MKKLISLLMCLTLIISTLVFTGVSVSAAEKLTYEFMGSWYRLVGVDKSLSGDVVIPETYNDLPVYEVYFDTFKDCNKITSVTLPDSVNYIAMSAFENCTSLKTIRIPEGILNTIQNGTFKNCTSLQSVYIPNNIKKIEFGAFENCTSLKTVTLPKELDFFDGHIFNGCSSLKSITLPNNIYSVPDFAFNGCSSLETVNIPAVATQIGMYAFNDCSSLKKIEIMKEVRMIGRCAFSGCTSLEEVSFISDQLHTIDEEAFANCSSLKKIVLPQSVTTIGARAFNGTTSLKNATVFDNAVNIGEQAFGYFYGTKLDNLTIFGFFDTKIHEYAIANNIPFEQYHPYKQAKVVLPTCGKDGYIDYVCDECSATYKEVLEATGKHTMKTTIVLAPTCKTRGLEKHYCSVCNSSETVSISNTPHDCNIKTVKATYFEKGKNIYSCKDCDFTHTEFFDKLTLKVPSVTINGAKKAIKVTYKKVKGANGFSIRYKKSNAKKWTTITVKKNANTSKTISKLKKGNYKVQVCSTLKKGKKIASSNWTAVKAIKVK